MMEGQTMPCDTVLKSRQTKEQRSEEIKAAVKRVTKALGEGKAKLKVNAATGAVAIDTTEEKDGVMDACMYRRLSVENSFEFRKALATAEAGAGRKVNIAVMDAGWHSHDGGKTWGKH